MGNLAKVMAGASVSISDFKANPNAVMQASDGEAIAILKSNEPCFYAVPPALFEMMAEATEDLALLAEANARLNDGQEAIAVNLDDL